MCAAAHSGIVDRRERHFPGIHHLQFFDPSAFQFVPHNFGKRTNRGLIDIRHLKRRGIHFVAGTHGTDDGRICGVCVHNKRDFARYRVNRVHDVVIIGKTKLICRVGHIKSFMGGYPDVGIDFGNPLCGNVHLVFPYGFVRGVNLAVDVGQTHLVIIDQVNRAHAGAHQRLHGIAAHAADAKHGNAGSGEFFHRLFSDQKLCS